MVPDLIFRWQNRKIVALRLDLATESWTAGNESHQPPSGCQQVVDTLPDEFGRITARRPVATERGIDSFVSWVFWKLRWRGQRYRAIWESTIWICRLCWSNTWFWGLDLEICRNPDHIRDWDSLGDCWILQDGPVSCGAVAVECPMFDCRVEYLHVFVIITIMYGIHNLSHWLSLHHFSRWLYIAPATSNQQPATSNQQPATSNQSSSSSSSSSSWSPSSSELIDPLTISPFEVKIVDAMGSLVSEFVGAMESFSNKMGPQENEVASKTWLNSMVLWRFMVETFYTWWGL